MQYSDYDPEDLQAAAVGDVVMISNGPEIDGYTSPAEARAFAAQLIEAADEAERYVPDAMHIRDRAEHMEGGCHRCGEPLDVPAWNWCSACVDKCLADAMVARRARS